MLVCVRLLRNKACAYRWVAKNYDVAYTDKVKRNGTETVILLE